MRSVICEAIHTRARLELSYGGGLRVVEPHRYGRSAAGHDLLRAYQLSGHSRSGEHEGWKLFDVANAPSISLAGESFDGARPDYTAADSAMTEVYCEL